MFPVFLLLIGFFVLSLLFLFCRELLHLAVVCTYISSEYPCARTLPLSTNSFVDLGQGIFESPATQNASISILTIRTAAEIAQCHSARVSRWLPKKRHSVL